MDLRAVLDGSGGQWTEERHSHYLSWIEASFVRRTFGVDHNGYFQSPATRGRCPAESDTESTGESHSRSPSPAPADPVLRRSAVSSRESSPDRESSPSDSAGLFILYK
ncbi:hypothetical protein AXF42_Ash012666 [Apostasia shenzhenica]|uniref:Uncharacterized protein n=1 Tax=Apostasia shenzhenica TaxID=1088818 RepID=A0A2H9ZTC2_9ASPA|nr:hypothetical protein AXF42_Ash012666 [Apostasia shenzhenica]